MVCSVVSDSAYVCFCRDHSALYFLRFSTSVAPSIQEVLGAVLRAFMQGGGTVMHGIPLKSSHEGGFVKFAKAMDISLR